MVSLIFLKHNGLCARLADSNYFSTEKSIAHTNLCVRIMLFTCNWGNWGNFQASENFPISFGLVSAEYHEKQKKANELILRKCCSNRQIESLCVILVYFWYTRIYTKNQLHHGNPVKTLQLTGKKTHLSILADFWSSKRFGSLSFKYLWPYNFIQHIRKN